MKWIIKGADLGRKWSRKRPSPENKKGFEKAMTQNVNGSK
jgi:hypothetical protein